MTDETSKPDRPTREAFIQEVEQALRAAGLEGPIEHDEEHGTLRHAERGPLDVEGAYHALADKPEAKRSEMISTIARVYVSPPRLPEKWEEAEEHILPVVKPRLVLVDEAVRRQRGGGPPPAPVAELTEHLVFGLGVPVAEGTAEVSVEVLEMWGKDAETAFRTAAVNLEQRSEANWLVTEEAPGVFASPWQDGFDAARLCLPRLFGRVPLEGMPVAVAPSPRLLLIAGSDDEEGLFHLGRMARRTVERNESFLFLRPLRMGESGETWENWLPPDSHPAHEVLKLLHAINERTDYDQHAWFVSRLAGPDDDVMDLPSVLILQSAIGAAVLTVTVWKEGRPAALPRADRIVLMRGDEVLGHAPWDEVAEAWFGSTDPLPGYPPRYLADRFPEDWQLGGVDLQPWPGPPPE